MIWYIRLSAYTPKTCIGLVQTAKVWKNNEGRTFKQVQIEKEMIKNYHFIP